ncbi:MAG: hypothetical protein QOJ97_1044 [Solirubrobacteraceae bacterium]|jgi:lipoprotein-anchoring transpeptidase ErfK/SrfK|nr:hypothetical protein [Solirubrobacteraceae bacterium]
MRTAAARAAAALALAALAVSGCGGAGSEKAPAAPAPQTVARPAARPGVIPGHGTVTAFVTADKVLRARPGGRTLARLPRHTGFGSPRIVAVVSRRGRWLGVLAPELRNGQVGWIDGRRGVRLYRIDWSLEVSLSKRLLLVRRGGKVVDRVRVAVGRPSAPTPTGLFAVTDKLTTSGADSPYGCCVLPLTGHQPSLPQGWGGGDRLAIHATPAEQSIGHAASLGCLRATGTDMRRLLREIPLGTRVQIHR